MRIRKYRFWDKVEKRMIYPEETDCLYLDQNGKVNYCEIIIDDLSETDRFIPMDYINLKDKNGKEIYEEDIVCFWDKELSRVRNEKVYFENGTFCVNGRIGTREWGKIIGNIYENPEFLKENK